MDFKELSPTSARKALTPPLEHILESVLSTPGASTPVKGSIFSENTGDEPDHVSKQYIHAKLKTVQNGKNMKSQVKKSNKDAYNTVK